MCICLPPVWGCFCIVFDCAYISAKSCKLLRPEDVTLSILIMECHRCLAVTMRTSAGEIVGRSMCPIVLSSVYVKSCSNVTSFCVRCRRFEKWTWRKKKTGINLSQLFEWFWSVVMLRIDKFVLNRESMIIHSRFYHVPLLIYQSKTTRGLWCHFVALSEWKNATVNIVRLKSCHQVAIIWFRSFTWI